MNTKLFLNAAIVLPLLLAGAAPANAASSKSAAPIQLLQPGDAQLSCQALATQINELANAEAQAPRKRRGGFGSFGKMLGAAAPMLGSMGGMGGNGIGGALANQAIGAIQAGAAQSQAQGQADAASAAPASQTVAAQRRDRLMEFFQSKGC